MIAPVNRVSPNEDSGPRRRSMELYAVAFLTVATLLGFGPWLFGGRALYWGDLQLYFLPLLQFQAGEMHKGILPLWNPTILGGTPLVGNPQAWPLYFPSVLLPGLGAERFATLANVGHLYLAGLFFYGWLRHGRRLNCCAALLGAGVYLFGGFLVSKSQFPNMLATLAYVPLLLWLIERLVKRPGLASALLLSVATALQILAAHAQMTLFTFYLAALYLLFLLKWERPGNGSSVVSILRWGGIAASGGLALSAGQWLSVVQLARLAERQVLSDASAQRFVLTPASITNFVLPFRFGAPLSGDFHGTGNFWETACYIGWLPCGLALTAIVLTTGRHHPLARQTRFWFAMLLLSVWLALGWRAILFGIVYLLVPGINRFHDATRMLMAAAVAIPVLAAFGLQTVADRLHGRHRRVAVMYVMVIISCLDLAWHAQQMYPLKPVKEIASTFNGSPVQRRLHSDPFLERKTGRIMMFDYRGGRNDFISYRHYGQDDVHYMERLTETVTPNLGTHLGFYEIGGYEPVMSATAGRMLVAAGQYPPLNPEVGDRNLTAAAITRMGSLGVRDVIFYRDRPIPPLPGLRLIYAGEWNRVNRRLYIYRNMFFVPRARSRIGGMVTPLAITRETPDEVEIEVPAARREQLLELTDTYQPGWRAYCDGKPVPLQRAGNLCRAVQLPTGSPTQNHTVVFVYQPTVYVLGLFISLVALTAFSAAAMSGYSDPFYPFRKQG